MYDSYFLTLFKEIETGGEMGVGTVRKFVKAIIKS